MKHIIDVVEKYWAIRPELIKEYLTNKPFFDQLCKEVDYILRRELIKSKILCSNINYRTKSLKSFLEKYESKKYKNPILETTDFAGVRIEFLYKSDFARIEKLINKNFEVIEKVDKLNKKGVDQFGYGAYHFIIKLGNKYTGVRYEDLRSIVCEIQVRTVSQHAWAVINHHLAYKSGSEIPQSLQRELNSLAGLFEAADNSFEKIRAERKRYLAKIKESRSDPAKFLENDLNKESFNEYLFWKFPKLRLSTYENQNEKVYQDLDHKKYKKLKDIDDMVNKSDAKLRTRIRKKAIEEYGYDLKGWKWSASGEFLAVLALMDKDFKKNFPKIDAKIIDAVINKNA